MSDAAHREHPEVRTRAGVVRGRWRDAEPGTGARSAAFLGIPFAEPPVGRLRFAAPVPKRAWNGVLDAAAFGATPQRGDPGVTLIPEPSVPGESTLNVNVFSPDPRPTAEPLPVLVWIHGGGFVAGSPASDWYDGSAFNRDGVVTVVVSYRLGFDGFGWIEDAPANRAVRDWLLALTWVQENIAAFGGDPSRVTIAGQSAGGGAVLTLLGMECAQHRFHQAYAMSAVVTGIAPGRAEALARRMAAKAGVSPTVDAWRGVSEARVLDAQRAATAVTASSVRTMIDDGPAFGPVVDDDLIRRPTWASLRRGVGADTPLVIGSTDDEFSAVTAGIGRVAGLLPTGLLLRLAGVPTGSHAVYRAANRDVRSRGRARFAGRVLTDRVFRATVPRVAAARGAGSTWTYRFSWPSAASGLAQHCLDVPFFFDCLHAPAVEPLTGSHPPQSLADEIHATAVRFVRSGDPGWPVHDPHTRISRVFDVPSHDNPDAYAAVRPLLPDS